MRCPIFKPRCGSFDRSNRNNLMILHHEECSDGTNPTWNQGPINFPRNAWLERWANGRNRRGSTMEEPAVVAVGAGLLTCRDVDRGSYFLLLTSSFLLGRTVWFIFRSGISLALHLLCSCIFVVWGLHFTTAINTNRLVGRIASCSSLE